MKPSPLALTTRRTKQCAFTLTELVIIVAAVAVLAGVCFVGVVANSRQIKRAQCVANLKQFAMVTHIYASENRDRLPEMSSGVWAWDVPATVTSAMEDRGMKRREFYCPGTGPRFNDNYNFLNPAPNSLWNYFGSGSRIIGYLVAFSGPTSNPGSFLVSLTNQNTTIVSERIRLSTSTYLNVVPANSERVLLADATISENSAGTPANPAPAGSFVNVVGGFSVNESLVPHLSPHLKGTLPAGGNLAFKDGHVAWRPFAQMSLRATGQSRGFWW